MAADLVIRGARIVDGTGSPAYSPMSRCARRALARIGRITDDALHRIDVQRAGAQPRFIDIHTHYDAQLMFEPSCSPSSWHGVTTVVIGNAASASLPPSRRISTSDPVVGSGRRHEYSIAGGRRRLRRGSMRDLLDRFVVGSASMSCSSSAIARSGAGHG